MIARLFKLFRGKTEYEKMEDYLNQAENPVHLEILQRRWDLGYRS
jgi:hypothetical protein